VVFSRCVVLFRPSVLCLVGRGRVRPVLFRLGHDGLAGRPVVAAKICHSSHVSTPSSHSCGWSSAWMG
jgi:hypothetical protein